VVRRSSVHGLAIALAALACNAPPDVSPPVVDGRRIARADLDPDNWLSHGRDYGEQRYSPLAEISRDNVADLGLAWSTLLVDITERPYITVGFAAWLMLVPLAVTSTNGWQRRLGRKWVKLHRLVYAIAILGVVHYWWQTKLDVAEPLLYAFLLAVLLGVRLKHSREMQARRKSVDSKPAVATTYSRVEPP